MERRGNFQTQMHILSKMIKTVKISNQPHAVLIGRLFKCTLMISMEQKNVLPFLLKYLITDFNEVPINTIFPDQRICLPLRKKKKKIISAFVEA